MSTVSEETASDDMSTISDEAVSDEPAKTASVKKKKGVLYYLPLFGGILLLLIALCAVLLFFRRFALVGGRLCRTDTETVILKDAGLSRFRGLARCRDAREMDLRGNALSAEDYLALQKALPDCSIRWDVPLAGQRWDSFTESLSLEDIPPDWVNITYFPKLKSLTFLRCSDPAAISRLREYLPSCEIHYRILLGGTWYGQDISTLELTRNAARYEELMTQLDLFTHLTEVTLKDDRLSTEEKRALKTQYPDITFVWNIPAGDVVFPSTATELTFPADAYADITALSEQLDLFAGEVSVDFSGSGVPVKDRLYLMEQHPDSDISWSVSIHGTDYPWDTEQLDLNNVPLDTAAEIETAVSELPRLKYAEMCDTGLSTQTMAELCEKFPDVHFVWRVYLADYNLRTDATYFMPSIIYNGADLTDYNIWPLQYCTELVALDLGHMPITDLSFLYRMPKIKYLILAESSVSDLTPLSSLKELAFLEIFNMPIYDFSPLVECTNLQDLNISYTYARSNSVYDTLSKMPWLKRVWYCGSHLSATQLATLRRTMPDCQFYCRRGGEPTGSTWRYGGLYYEMRDAFEAMYMPGGTNDIDENGYQIIVDDYGVEFHLVGWGGEQRWWELYPDWDIHIIGITCDS